MRHGRKSYACRKQPFVEQLPRELKGSGRFAHKNGSDWRLASPCIEACTPQRALKTARVAPEPIDSFRFLFEQIKSRQACRSNGWRVRRGKEKRAGAMIKKFDQVSRPANIS